MSEYAKRHQAAITAHKAKYREKHWPIIKVQFWFKRRYNYLIHWEKTHKADRKHHLKRNYGVSVEQYEAMIAEQNKLCAICKRVEYRKGKQRYLCVDHDHRTGRIRGLLCHDCNTALGAAHDNPTTLVAMIAYLHQHRVGESF